MGVDRSFGDIVFRCDACGEELETNESDFSEALRELRRAGWKAEKVDGYWEHTCDACGCENDLDDFEDVS